MATVRLPRSFAGDKAAPLEDFLQSTAHALMRGDPAEQESITRLCARIQKELSARVIIDVGGLMRLKRNKMLELLAGIDKDLEYWVEYIEDVLEFEFPTSTAVVPFRDPAAPPPSAALVAPSSSYRVATYKTEKSAKEPGLGAQLQRDGQLDQVIFKPSMFPKIRTRNPQLETLCEPDVQYINDTVWEMTFRKYGEVHVDMIYRAHCGRQLRLLFPHLPTRGNTKGDERTFEEMLKWRFQNAVKQQAPGKKAYKPNLKIDRINLCEAAIELVEKSNFPITLTDEGILDTKFIISEEHSDEKEGDGKPMPLATVFGDEPPPKLPPPVTTTGALAPVPASAANCTATTQPPSGSLSKAPQKRNSAESDPKPAPKKAKKVFGPPRTEPVALFKESNLPFKALPFRTVQKDDEVVVCVPYTSDKQGEEGVLVDAYWYGIVSVACANACWIKFYDVDDDTSDKTVKPISHEKHKLKENEHFDRWILVERISPVPHAADDEHVE